MGFLTAVIGIENEQGQRFDLPRSDGTRAPIVLVLSDNFTAESSESGGLTRLAIDVNGAGADLAFVPPLYRTGDNVEIGAASDDNRGTMSTADFGKLKLLQPGYLGTAVSGASFVPAPNRLYVVTTAGPVACNLPAVTAFLDSLSAPGELIMKGFTMLIVGTAVVTINRNGTDEIYAGVDGMVVAREVNEPGIFVTVQAIGEGAWGVSAGTHEP